MSGNLIAWSVTSAGALAYLGFCGVVRKLKLMPSILTRKLMHIGTGPLYMLCWPLYTNSRLSPWICATVPLAAAAHFCLVGLGLVADPQLVASTTRSGDRNELLRGPFLYGIVHAAATVMFWRNSPDGIVALAVLCGGDGLAEVLGRTVSSRRLPHNNNKSVAGTVACFMGGLCFSMCLLHHFSSKGFLVPPKQAAVTALRAGHLLKGAALCSAVGAAVESLNIAGMDNILVTTAVAAAARAYFKY